MKTYSGSLVIEAPLPSVWDYLMDPHEIGATIPDVVEYSVESENQLKAKVKVGMGPVRAVMDLAAEIQAIEVPGRARLTIGGSGMGNGVQLTSTITLVEAEDGRGNTQVAWSADVVVSGPLAALGARLLDNQVKKATEQVFDNIRQGVMQKRLSS